MVKNTRKLANTIDAKDSYTNGHSTRVTQYHHERFDGKGYPDIADVMLSVIDEDKDYILH